MNRLSWKLVLLGGLAFFVAQWIIGWPIGLLIHDGVLEESYQETASFWRPELTQDPPDMVSLLPLWIATGLVVAFALAAIYGLVRPAFSGGGWKKGFKYGLVLAVFSACWNLGYSGIFNLPDVIWAWWTVEAFIFYPISAIVLGLVTQKVAPEAAAG